MTEPDRRQRLISLALKSICTIASIMFYGNSRNADWIYEKMNQPRTYGYQALNVLYYLMKKPRLHRVVSLVVEPVFGCNLSCSYCWHSITHYFEHKSKRPRLMPLEVFKQAMDQAPESVESVAFALIGEPLMHPQLHIMIAYAKNRGLRTVLYTNGTLLSGQVMQNIADSGLDVLVVSVEPDQTNAQKHRGVSLDAIRQKLEAFNTVKPGHMEVKLSVVVHDDNLKTLDQIPVTWEGLADQVKLSPLIRYNDTRLRGNCIEPWRGSLSILTSGEVSPCCISAGYRNIPIGNLHQSSLKHIINGPSFRRLLDDFIQGKRPEVCYRCKTFQSKHIPSRVPSLSGTSSGKR